MKKLPIRNRRLRRKHLSTEQMAVGELMCAAVREYSQSRYAAGWWLDIEHFLWDEVLLRKKDAYERACDRLCKLAAGDGWGPPRPRKRSLFAEGLRILSDRYGVWFYYQARKGERVISIKEWLPKHQVWLAAQIKQRMPYQKVWELAHFRPFAKRPRIFPPMPGIKLPPLHPAHRPPSRKTFPGGKKWQGLKGRTPFTSSTTRSREKGKLTALVLAGREFDLAEIQ